MSSRWFVKGMLLGAVAFPMIGSAAASVDGTSRSPNVDGTKGARPARTPNVVMIYVDDMDFDELKPYDYRKHPCYTAAWETGAYQPPQDDRYFEALHWHPPGERPYFENPRQYTPNLERLARAGMRFDRFYVTSTICTPSRYSLLTGNYASRCPALEPAKEGAVKNIRWNTPLAPNEDSLVKKLNRSGYTTALFGKWHNHFYEPGAAKPYTWETVYEGVERDDDARDPKVQSLIDEGYARAIAHLKGNIGFDVVDRFYAGNIYQLGLPKDLMKNNLEWITEGVVEFLDQKHEQPFFLYWAINLPHRQNSVLENNSDPLATPAGFLEKAPEPTVSRAQLKAIMKERDVDPQQFTSAWIDAQLGAVLDQLKQSGLDENTLLLVVSDHQSRGKFTCYEGARVPAFAYWPGRIPAGSINTDLLANIDIAPTVLALAGAELEAEGMDGENILASLEGKPNSAVRDSLLLETGYTRAVVSKDWKYIHNLPPQHVLTALEKDSKNTPRTTGWDGAPGSTKWGVRYGVDAEFAAYFDTRQLYSMESDWLEQTNLVGNAAFEKTEKQLAAELQRLMAGIGDAMPAHPGRAPSPADRLKGKPTNAGTYLEAPDVSNDVPGGTGKSMRFGMNKGKKKSGVQYGDILDSGAGTCSLWLKPNTMAGQDYLLKTSGFKLMCEGPSYLKVIYKKGGNPWNELGKTPVAAGQWIHAAVTWNEAKRTVSYYVNGSLVASKNDADLAGLSNGGINVGSFSLADNTDKMGNQYDGLIYDLNFYDRELLAEEVSRLALNP
ncbi:sulfatase-like hydrolase/transferase [Pontiella sulfatireligans]|uniref:Choline-sulfatase n=1 Tax=Pontiella sulfatireligans TaxID=2750658 RepID=A0A6C2UNW4_9BACT|nr:sulfatase-like hydrolase/transferase [Pontiella sulfatireligans]SPS74482.1 sulfatase S1_51 [Kiritimatiellales bacterium]VGO21980.1 Choline-sulfatase [Pontiella sulfatireligans]